MAEVELEGGIPGDTEDCGKPPEAGREAGNVVPQSLRRNESWISGLQDRERIRFCCFNSPRFQYSSPEDWLTTLTANVGRGERWGRATGTPKEGDRISQSPTFFP